MSNFINPFSPSTTHPGTGTIHLTILPPSTQSLQTLTYQYPLKLISPDPHFTPPTPHHPNSIPKPITTIFLLTYGGGLVGGDTVALRINLDPATRLVLLTQGSTKIFKAPRRDVLSRQGLDVRVGRGAALCYLPDPAQPFGGSVFEQRQCFQVEVESSLCVLDWVTEGRRARGESWAFCEWSGRNEVREIPSSSAASSSSSGPSGKGRLLLRDLVILSDGHDSGHGGNGLADRTDGLAVLGTLILLGPVFKELSEFVMNTFSALPRIGAKDWTASLLGGDSSPAEGVESRKRVEWERPGLLWTAARVRGCVIVKFGAKELDVAKGWLNDLLSVEGSVEREFGHQALFCLQ